MRRAQFIEILRPTSRDVAGELWSFTDGEQIAVGGERVEEHPPRVPTWLAVDLIRAHDAQAASVREISEGLESNLELVGVQEEAA